MWTKAKLIRSGAIFIIALLLILTTLFSGNNVVLNDNGDFGRVERLCSLGKNSEGVTEIQLESDNFFANVSNILFTPGDISTYPSSQLIFVRASVLLNYIVNTVTGSTATNYNIYYLGLMMSVLYALALTFLFSQINTKNKYVTWMIIAVGLICMCDIGYVSYFNSLYAEGLQHILLIVLAGFFPIIYRRSLNYFETAAFFITLVLYGQSKFFNIPVAVIVGVTALVLSLRHKPKRKKIVIDSCALGLSVIILLVTMGSLPGWISRETNYNAVFYGIVRNCSDEQAKQYLENDLGLDPELYVLKDTHHYVSNFQEISANYDITGAEEISKIKLILFYLKHPEITLSKIPHIAHHSGVIRNIFFMDENYMSDAMRCTLWSKVRENTGFDTVFVNLAVIAGVLCLLIIRMKRDALPRYIIISIPILIVAAFGYLYIVPYISNGEADLAKHMYTFVELIDLSLLAVIMLCAGVGKRAKAVIATGVAIVMMINVIPRNPGKTVTLGGYEWYVIDSNSEYDTLIMRDSVAVKSYDNTGSNLYAESDIHKWLNGEFLDSFSKEERAMLCLKNERVILSATHVALAERGNRDFYCSAFPAKVETNYSTAYSHNVEGYVFLPSARHISAMAQKGYDVSLREKYWLSTPYFNGAEKSRYVNPDGTVYFENTTEKMGVRPVIHIKTNY